jgi:hypothetical protein
MIEQYFLASANAFISTSDNRAPLESVARHFSTSASLSSLLETITQYSKRLTVPFPKALSIFLEDVYFRLLGNLFGLLKYRRQNLIKVI